MNLIHLKCEACDVPWKDHDNALQCCHRIQDLQNQIQLLTAEIKSLTKELDKETLTS